MHRSNGCFSLKQKIYVLIFTSGIDSNDPELVVSLLNEVHNRVVSVHDVVVIAFDPQSASHVALLDDVAGDTRTWENSINIVDYCVWMECRKTSNKLLKKFVIIIF